MYSIYDVMNYVAADINTVGIGQCASAGSFILAAGTKGKRTVLENTSIMIHELSGGTQGKAQDMFVELEKLKKMYDKMAKQYVKFTSKSLSKIKKDMSRDNWMDAEEALSYGLIDKIIKGN